MACRTTEPRILVARPDHLGDVLLTLPALAALRQVVPSARISYLVAPSVAAAAKLCPMIDETLTAPFPLLSAPFDPDGLSDLVSRLAPALRDRFDLAILSRYDDPWASPLVAAAGVPLRIGFDSPGSAPFLTHRVPTPRWRQVACQAIELVDAVAAILGLPTTAGIPETPSAWLVPTAAEDAEAVEVLDRTGTAGTDGPIVLHPGSGWPIKNWRADRWGAVAAALGGRYGTAPLVVGGPSEGRLVDAVVAASGGRASGVAGEFSLGGLAALHRRARLVIATDSGPLHLTAFMGAPIVGLYGPADPVEFGPWCPPERRRIVRSGLGCSPCRSLHSPPCGVSADPRCMTGVEADHVLAAADDLLNAGRRDDLAAPDVGVQLFTLDRAPRESRRPAT